MSSRTSSLSSELVDFLNCSGLLSWDWVSGEKDEREKEVFCGLSLLIF